MKPPRWKDVMEAAWGFLQRTGDWAEDRWDAHVRVLAPPSDRPIRRALLRAVRENALPLGSKVYVPGAYRVVLKGIRYQAFRPLHQDLERTLAAGLSQHFLVKEYAFDPPVTVEVAFEPPSQESAWAAPEVSVVLYPCPSSEGEIK
jgi:hypothetical protein